MEGAMRSPSSTRSDSVPPPIPARTGHAPPPIPTRTESAPPPNPVRTESADTVAPTLSARDQSPQAALQHSSKLARTAASSPRRRPIGAVPTVMVSGDELRHEASISVDRQQQERDPDSHEDPDSPSLARNPYDLKALVGSTVTASYPFNGEERLQQLSFAVGDLIKVKHKEDMWSWGVLERGGQEGWFPHNYVGTTFKPLPGIHEMAAKLRERREKQEAAQPFEDTRAAQESAAALHDGAASIAISGTTQLLPLEGGALDDVGTRSAENRPYEPHVLAESLPSASHGALISSDVHVKGTVGETNGSVAPDHGVVVTTQELCSDVGTVGGPRGETQRRHAFGETAKVTATALPTLPPFLKDGNMSNVATSGNAPTQRGSDEAQTSELHEAIQIDGLGNAGRTAIEKSGCKCIIT